MNFQQSIPSRPHGFSLLELLIVASLCVVLFTSGSLAYRAVAQNQRRSSTFQEVPITSPVAANFFPGSTASVIDSYTAPNYGRAGLAQQMRNLFYEDVDSGCAVFALPRSGNINGIRERIINIGSNFPAVYDTPEKFLSLLANLPGTTARLGGFQSYRGIPADTTPIIPTPSTAPYTTPLVNGSIFIIQTSGSASEIWIRAVYEIDYIPFSDDGTPCVHASVRRYVDSVLTNFYDIVFRNSQIGDIGVPFVHFERSARTNVVEPAITPWKAAPNQPFYLIWWPDPTAANLKGTSRATYTGLRQANYAKHEGQTSFTFVVPQFPSF